MFLLIVEGFLPLLCCAWAYCRCWRPFLPHLKMTGNYSYWPPFPSRMTKQTPLANKYNIWRFEYSVIWKAERLVPVSSFS